MRVWSVTRVRESKHTRLGRLPARAEQRKRGLPRRLRRGRSSAEDRPAAAHPSAAAPEEDHVRRRRGSTRISCSRISVNQVTMRPRPADGCRNRRVGIAFTPRRGGTRRAVVYRVGSGKGGNSMGWILSIARSTARAFPPSDFSRGGRGWEGGKADDEGTILRHDVALHHTRLRPKLLAAKRSLSPRWLATFGAERRCE